MKYDFSKIETKWRKFWKENQTFKTEENLQRPKFYILDMFPYPSGSGLHVGHPLGFIASDIYARYKRLSGYNVLHPMGYDAFGLPAEQYAIQTGNPPKMTTEQNIQRYRKQLDLLGFAYDWSREVRTCAPDYYHWTQWAFIKMFQSYYDTKKQKALPIKELIAVFNQKGNLDISAYSSEVETFNAKEWQDFDEKKKDQILGAYRLAYRGEAAVNWCPHLGTVLANDEVQDGLSVRGGHPVIQKKMKQWFLRISAYAERLLTGLNDLDWSDSLKEIQRHWIGRSEGAEIFFDLLGLKEKLTIYTTRPDTLFGVTFMVLAPESEWVEKICTPEHKKTVLKYIKECAQKTQREHSIENKNITGVFTGGYAKHPFNGNHIPIWVADYVLGEYGTGAIMAVPAHDQRDHAFAKKFNLPIIPVIASKDQEYNVQDESYDTKKGLCINSDFLNGLDVTKAIQTICQKLEKQQQGCPKVNYRLRDAIFSRQRYWGEPLPIYYKNEIPHPLDEDELPLVLPEIDNYLPTKEGNPPLGHAVDWKNKDGYPLELTTMPGFAGSSAYFIRYMDPNNKQELCSKKANQYWQNVDLYLGGSEHATGHLIYARFWNKVLYDLGYICNDEPFKRLINQGMIQGRSNFVYRLKSDQKTFVSYGLKKSYDVQKIHVDVGLVSNDILDLEKFKRWRPDFTGAKFILEDGKYYCGHGIEKMSKSFYNVVNPDDIVEKYGADTLRLYEMFLGPLDQAKPWNTNGIEGVYRFLTRFWGLFFQNETLSISKEAPTPNELKILHTCIKKVDQNMEGLAFNTSISAFMIAVNDLIKIKCSKQSILEPLVVLLSPFAPHIAEELYSFFGHTKSVLESSWPKWDEKYLEETTFQCPISFNGKTRLVLSVPLDQKAEAVKKSILEKEAVQKYLQGKTIKKVIYVPGKIFNIVF